jgi:hypothetical protein
MTNLLTNNPNVFLYVHEDENGEQSEVMIDFQELVSFCRTIESDGSIELGVKYTHDSKAFYSFESEEPYNRFVKEYDAYVKSRNELVLVARDLAKNIATAMKDEMMETSKEIMMESIKQMQVNMQKELEMFKSEIKSQAELITNTALQHQKEINSENMKHLELMKENELNAKSLVSTIEEFSSRIGSVAHILDVIAPSSTATREKEAQMNEKLKEEASSI